MISHIVQQNEKEAFLEAYASSKSISDALKHVGVSRRDMYRARNADADFKEAWDDTVNSIKDELEGNALRIAIEGWLEPIIYRGETVGYKRCFAPPLMQFMLKALKPETYADRNEGMTAEQFALEVANATSRMQKSVTG